MVGWWAGGGESPCLCESWLLNQFLLFQDITDFRPVANLMLFIVAVTFLLSIGSFACFHIYLAT